MKKKYEKTAIDRRRDIHYTHLLRTIKVANSQKIFQFSAYKAKGISSGAAEVGVQGIQLHTLILEVQSYDSFENRYLFIFSLGAAYSDLDHFRRPC